MNILRKALGISGHSGPSPLRIGLIVLGAVLLFGLAVFKQHQILTTLKPGDTVQAEFARGYKLQPYHSKVKIADVEVGTITSSEATDRNTALVSMKLDSDMLEKLGDSPSAAITATTLLGGTYYVQLIPGGRGTFDNNTPIPTNRTSTPVELGDVLTAFTPEALKAVPGTIGRFDQTLRQGGTPAIRDLLATGPATLQPGSEVLAALRGNRPDTDLTAVETGLQNTAAGLLQHQGQLGVLLRDFQRGTAALAGGSRSLAESISTDPNTFRTTRAGLTDLDSTLHRLTTTSDSLRPTARQLSSLLREADPVLARARPVISDLRDVLSDARPTVERLNPALDHGTRVFHNLRGPTLDRLKGPIADAVNNPWHGTGVYKNGGSPNKGYEELAYLAVNGALAWQTHDGNETLARLAASAGGQTVGGSAFPQSLEEYFQDLNLVKHKGPQADRPGPTQGPLSLEAPR